MNAHGAEKRFLALQKTPTKSRTAVKPPGEASETEGAGVSSYHLRRRASQTAAHLSTSDGRPCGPRPSGWGVQAHRPRQAPQANLTCGQG